MNETKLAKLLKQDKEIAISDRITVSLCWGSSFIGNVGVSCKRTLAKFRSDSFGACASQSVRCMARSLHEIRQ